MTTYQLISGLSGDVDWSDPNIWIGGVVPNGFDATAVDLENPGATTNGALQIGNSNLAGDAVGSLTVGYGVELASFLYGGGPLTVFGPALIEGIYYLSSPASLLSSITVSTTGVILLAGSGTIVGPVDNDGTILSVPADFQYTFLRNVVGNGTIDLGGSFNEESGGNFIPFAPSLILEGSDTNAIEFGVPAGSLTLDRPAGFTGTIEGFSGPVDIHYNPSTPSNDTREAPGNEIVLEGVSAASIVSESYAGDATGGVLTINETDGTSLDLRFAGQYTIGDFAFAATPDGTGTVVTDTVVYTMPCFATGTRISTPAGATAVEDLAEGDEVRLAHGGNARIRWIGHRRQSNGPVIRIAPHALGRNAPVRNLIVSPDHGLLVDGLLVQACLLADGHAIMVEGCDEVTLWHIELDRHAILLAEGAPAESYLDTGNRRRFANCAFHYDPVADAAASEPCAEMVFAGERLDRIRDALRKARTEPV